MAKVELDPLLIPKYVNPLFIPPAYKPVVVKDQKTGKEISHNYTITMSQFTQQILPKKFPKTTVWGFEGKVTDPKSGKTHYQHSSPGATIKAVKGIPVNVQWVNAITEPNLFAVDPTLHWANPNNMPMPEPPFLPYPEGYPLAQSPTPLVVHVHGAEVRSDSDGFPDSWFTAGEEKTGSTFTKSRYSYPNEQEAATLWYHDHTLGLTRLNVYAGLAGFYLINDPKNSLSEYLPSGEYDVPLVIQDRSFYDDGSLLYPSNGINPQLHPYWRPAFVGNTIMVNGRVWPNFKVEPRQYRFRLLNGSNSRIYKFKLSNNQSFTQISSDGGLLPQPVELTELLLAPAERADIIVDFSRLAAGESIILENIANTPFPNGAPADPETVGQIMKFTISDKCPTEPKKLPDKLNIIPKLIPNVLNTTVTLNVAVDSTGLSALLLNGQMWHAPVSEEAIIGSTVEWEIVNMTNGAHPIHIHLIQFLIKNRQNYDSVKYAEEWTKLNGTPPLENPTVSLSPEPYLQGEPIEPPLNETGWKDTVLVMPNQVTRLLIRYAPQEAKEKDARPCVNLFPFDPSYGPGYVWHCHIIDHEDNDMMRPYKVVPCIGCDIQIDKTK